MPWREQGFEVLEEYGVRKRLALHPLIYYLGFVWIVAAATLIVPALYGLIFHYHEPREYTVSIELLEYGTVFMVLGLLSTRLTMPSRRMRREEALLLVVITWVLIPLVVAWPIADVLGIPFVDAWFESVSGFTTTGLTMFTGSVDPVTGTYVPAVEELPRTVLFWRSFIQWVGGVGIVVVAVSIIARPGSAARLLYVAEGRSERIEPSVIATAKKVLFVYTIVTVIDTILLYVAGMDWFDAVNHAMTGIATGGFSTKNNSIAEYHSIAIELAAMFAMFSGAVSFSDWHSLIIKWRLKRFFSSPELKALLTLMAIGTIAATAALVRNGFGIIEALRYASFQIVTTITGTGFQNTGLGDKPEIFKALLTTYCLLGGAAFSTTGGIKMLRLIIAVKSTLWEAEALSAPRGYTLRRRLAWIVLDDESARRALTIIFAFSLTMVVGTFIAMLILPDRSFADVALETASALGNVGVSTGITGADSPLALKLLYIALMTLGRLEIVPYFYAVHVMYSKVVHAVRARRGRRKLLRETRVAREAPL
ncbi:cation transporter [Pyrolobus fumarii 1A]|uniref:Cation transporter n=1 Tax=Pyrolobus fumarii (strain DSM 11204 / 1A) TaxID=694429 RepID=G0ED01_PYRF1|nr:TrkH family potassium uptake protein [Pyrolobus fumarii]AEM39721.1 cation transporter [Pyrolobus fumarii 1A]